MRVSSSSIIAGVLFWGFFTVKMWGHVFAAWSWWWMLLPLIPWLGLAVQHWGL